MSNSRLFYKMMLWALAGAAACGVLAMLTASYDTLGRVSATALATAVAAGAAWGLAESLERPTMREARVAGFATIVVSYLFALLGIWDVAVAESSITSIVTGLSGSLIAAFLGLRLIEWLRTAAYVGIAIAVVSWTIAMIGVWGEVQKCIGSSFAIGIPGMIAVVCLIRISFTPASAWRWIGVLAATAAGAVMLLDIWDQLNADDKQIIVLFCICVTVAHASLVVLIPLRPNQLWVRAATIVAAVLTATCLCTIVVWELRGNSFAGRLAGAAAIAAGCGTLSLAILRKFNTTQSSPQVGRSAITRITFFCPKCGLKQVTPFGSLRCRKCQLELRIDLSVQATNERGKAR